MIRRNYVEQIRDEFRYLKQQELYVTDKTGVKMLEIRGASFVADAPAIFGTVNQDYVDRELAWYQSQSLNVNDIPGGPPAIWKQVADSDGFINSNYGWAIWSPENHEQYNHVLFELLKNPESRRATMIYTRPTMWYDYNFDGRSDFMCTNAVQYMIRYGKLEAVVQMRSNDVVFGYKNDYAWQKHVLDTLATDLSEMEGGMDVTPGTIHWNVGSLHVYERHFNLID
jgi:thymidylate synthase